jgi:hypothetical protein
MNCELVSTLRDLTPQQVKAVAAYLARDRREPSHPRVEAA